MWMPPQEPAGVLRSKDNPAVYTPERQLPPGFLNWEWKQTVTESTRRGPWTPSTFDSLLSEMMLCDSEYTGI